MRLLISRLRQGAPILICAFGLGALCSLTLQPRPPGTTPRAGASLPPADTPAETRYERVARPPWYASRVATLTARARGAERMRPRLATRLQKILDNLRSQGTAALPAIQAFLGSGDDIDFTAIRGGTLVGHRTLRQALLDCVLGIGGSAAMAVALEQLQTTHAPVEIAMLARGLEREEPGVHRARIVEAIDDALFAAEDLPARTSADVAPLFDLLRGFGDPSTVPLLERSVPRWGAYALIALADLPEGAGIPSLAALASAVDAPLTDRALPFQVLAQTTAAHPEAAGTLLDLARAGKIPDRIWKALGEALAGTQLQLSRRMFDGTPLATEPRPSAAKTFYIEWLNVRYEQSSVSEGWSPEQIDQQLALIDELLATTSDPVAVAALHRAQMLLTPGADTPI